MTDPVPPEEPRPRNAPRSPEPGTPAARPGRDLLGRLARGPVVADGAMGTLLYATGRLPPPLLRRGQPRGARARGGHPPRLPARGRGGAGDELVRGEPGEARAPRPRRAHGGDQPPGGGDRAGRRGRRGGRAGGHGPARHPHGAVGPDERRRGAGALRAAGPRARGGRRRRLLPRDLRRPRPRSTRRCSRAARARRACPSSAR